MRVLFAVLFTFLPATRAAEYVGSQACAGCHAGLYRTYMRTPMARSSGRIGASPGTEQFIHSQFRNAQGTYTYRVSNDAGRYSLWFQATGSSPGAIQGKRVLDYFIGSGSAARSYLFRDGQFLYEAPVAYYRKTASWTHAPGYQSYDFPFLTRPALPGCLGCHSSRLQPIAGTQNAYADPPFLEGGVGCERCHGPGSAHVASGTPMVNPARLTPKARDSICEQCHLSGEIRVTKSGKHDTDFRAGDMLEDFLTVFIRAGSPGKMRVTSHAEDLARSTCSRASGGKLWCASCHDPHKVPAAAQTATYYRGKCLSCHQTTDCNAPQAERKAGGDNCISCHMPRNEVSDVEHVVFTDHSIRRRPTALGTPAADAELVPVGGGTATVRDLGVAYAMVALREQNATYRERSFRLLQQAAGNNTADVTALSYLAEFYRDRGDDAHALPLYQQVWRLDPTQYAAAAALGAYQFQSGNLDEAIRLWTGALAISPALPLVRTNLATALLRKGRNEEARAMLKRALEFNPSLKAPRDLLNRIPK